MFYLNLESQYLNYHKTDPPNSSNDTPINLSSLLLSSELFDDSIYYSIKVNDEINGIEDLDDAFSSNKDALINLLSIIIKNQKNNIIK